MQLDCKLHSCRRVASATKIRPYFLLVLRVFPPINPLPQQSASRSSRFVAARGMVTAAAAFCRVDQTRSTSHYCCARRLELEVADEAPLHLGQRPLARLGEPVQAPLQFVERFGRQLSRWSVGAWNPDYVQEVAHHSAEKQRVSEKGFHRYLAANNAWSAHSLQQNKQRPRSNDAPRLHVHVKRRAAREARARVDF